MPLQTIKVENPNGVHVVLGESHFTKIIDNIHTALTQTLPELQFGLAYKDATGSNGVQFVGTNEDLKQLAAKNADNIGVGDMFVLFLDEDYPVDVMKALKQVPEIVEIYCAGKPVEVIVVETDKGRGIMGMVDENEI